MTHRQKVPGIFWVRSPVLRVDSHALPDSLSDTCPQKEWGGRGHGGESTGAPASERVQGQAEEGLSKQVSGKGHDRAGYSLRV